jgi:putative tryptophan/tyrosine transport system substrate-binding protein
MTSTDFFFDRERLASIALRHRIPTIFAFRQYVEVGGLLSYGPDIRAMYGLAADYVDRIVRGAKPADMPVEQPTKFEFVINLKSAKALRLDVPDKLQQLADEVIE